MLPTAVASPPTIAPIVAAAAGFVHLQLQVPKDLRHDCQPYQCKVTSSVEMLE